MSLLLYNKIPFEKTLVFSSRRLECKYVFVTKPIQGVQYYWSVNTSYRSIDDVEQNIENGFVFSLHSDLSSTDDIPLLANRKGLQKISLDKGVLRLFLRLNHIAVLDLRSFPILRQRIRSYQTAIGSKNKNVCFIDLIRYLEALKATILAEI